MKSYLDLIPVSGRVRRKQTRMTRLCIAVAVFLIASIFGMADMFLQSQKYQAIQSDGAWHVGFKGLTQEQIDLIGARPEISAGCRYAATNYRLDMDYTIDGTKTVVCGFDASFFELFPGIRLTGGAFPAGSGEALVTESVGERLNLSVGDGIELKTPDGAMQFRISGFVEDTSNLLKGGAFGIFLDTDTYCESFRDATLQEDFVYYAAFAPGCRIRKTIEDIVRQLDIPQDAAGENTKLLGLLLQSRDSYILALYLAAAVLALLVAFAGMLMILGSLNSSVAQRTEFFGLMGCLGATGRQIRRFVRREALSWCKAAVPCGLAASVLSVWMVCAALKTVSPTYFGAMPRFGVSLIGLSCGCVIGILTVLAASRVPARKAAKVSPLTAVSGNADTVFPVKRAANTGLFHVETALGIHHAAGSRKNLMLLTLSFAFGIILFLGFSTGVDFMQHALTPLRPYTPDVSVSSRDNGCDVPAELLGQIKADPDVKRVFGRSFAYDVPAGLHGENKTVMLISYEAYQFGWAQGDLIQGQMERVQDGEGVLLVEKEGFSAKAGDELELETALGRQTVKIEGILSYVPFNAGAETGTVICSEQLFRQLTGESGYTILDVQLEDASDLAAERIRDMAGGAYNYSDHRESNREVRAVYYSFALFVYGFLAVIALIAVFNIINSIGMSVSARMRQYGAMRAIGISVRQLNRMVAAETLSYLACSLLIGLGAGFPLHYYLYREIITARWGDAWRLPAAESCIIAAVMICSAAAAIAGPVRRMRRMSVVDTIHFQ